MEISTDSKITNAEALINETKDLGIKLWEEDSKLKFKAPKGVMTDTILAKIKENKAAIIDFLKSANQEITVVADQENRLQPFPLSDVQSAYLLGRNEAFEYGGVDCHLYLEFDYNELDPERATHVWNLLIARHEMLKAVVNKEGYQQILSNVSVYNVGFKDTTNAVNPMQELAATRSEMSNGNYDTEKWPLFDIRVTKTPQKSVLHFSMLFLIADFASMWMLLSEFETLYYDKAVTLPKLGLSFRDYLIAERGLRATSTYIKDKEYWMKRVPMLPAGPKLPLERKQDVSSNKFIRNQLNLNANTWNDLKQKAQSKGVTPTVVVMSAYAAVLERWGKTDHFCLNLTVLNRLPLHEQVYDIVGDFTSVSLLEIDWSKGTSFIERAKQQNIQLLKDLDHRLYTGVEVMRALNRLHGKEKALMPYVFTSAIGLTPASEENKLKGQVTTHSISQTPQVFIDCQAFDSANGLMVNWDAREGVFPDTMVKDMFEAFESLLIQLSENDAIWQEDHLISLPKRQKEERKTVNNVRTALPTAMLHEAIVKQITACPNKEAIVDAFGSYTYDEIGKKATSLAKVLKENGCKPQDKIAITLPKSAMQVVSVLASLSAQGVYIPIDITQPEGRRLKMVENAGVKFVITSKNIAGQFPQTVHVIYIEDLTTAETVDLAVKGDPTLPAYVIYTSGSTGQPKGVVISHQAAMNTIVDVNKRFTVNHTDAVLGLAQLGFDLSVFDIFGVLGQGGKIIYTSGERHTDPSHWVTLIQEHKVSVWNTVPALLQMLVNYMSSERGVSLPSFRLALVSGDWVPLHLPEELKSFVPSAQLISLGGATEASIWSNYHVYEGLKKDWVSIPYGKPLTNQGFRVLDAKWRDRPEWGAGDLYITGDGLALGYLNDETLTQTKFFKHPIDGQMLYKTGDLGRYMPDGILEFLGREDKQVKIRGHRIELGEIETAIQEHPAVGSARVIVSDEGKDKNLLGFVAPIAKSEKNTTNIAANFVALTQGVHEESETHVSAISPQDIQTFHNTIETASLEAIISALQQIDLFLPGVVYSENQVIASEAIQEKYQWLVKRWIAILIDFDYIKTIPNEGVTLNTTKVFQGQSVLWSKARNIWASGFGSEKFVDYIESNAHCLTAILAGKKDPLELLFPEGSTAIIEALYIDNAMAKYLSSAIATLVTRIATKKKTLRILEIGAGSGATTTHCLEALKEFDTIEYYFTDAFTNFVTSARATFKDDPRVKFAIYNIDEAYRKQGFVPNSFDVVIASGVLENAENIPYSLREIKELIKPEGWFLYSEPTREHPWIMITQAFLMKKPDDELRAVSSYLSKEEWNHLTEEFGNGTVLSLPEQNHKLDRFGIHLFATQVKTDKEPIQIAVLKQQLQKNIPAYMIPSHIQVVDEFPLTKNGKVDLKQLALWKPVHQGSNAALTDKEEALSNNVEIELANMWSEALGVSNIGKNDNFYTLGADSLIMAQMAGRVKDAFSDKNKGIALHFDTVLKEILNAPTVAELAAFIGKIIDATDKKDLENTEDTETTNIGAYTNFGGGTAGPLRFILPAGLGTMDCFRPLIEYLTKQNLGPVVGASISDVDRYVKEDPRELINIVSDDYTAYIVASGYKKVQLIGYCLGSLTATEIARRLQEKGIEVVDLILIDGERIPFNVEDELIVESFYLPNMMVATEMVGFGAFDYMVYKEWFLETLKNNNQCIPKGVTQEIGGTTALDKLGDVFRKMATYTEEERFKAYIGVMPATNGEKMPFEMVMRMYKTYCQSFKASQFTPDPYFGAMRYLVAEDNSASIPGQDEAPVAFWNNVCLGDFTTDTIQGNHYSCIEPPYVAHVAELIGQPLFDMKKV